MQAEPSMRPWIRLPCTCPKMLPAMIWPANEPSLASVAGKFGVALPGTHAEAARALVQKQHEGLRPVVLDDHRRLSAIRAIVTGQERAAVFAMR